MDIKQFIQEMQAFERTLDNVYNELDSSVVDNLEGEISGLRDSLRDIESTVDDWSSQLDEVRDEFKALKDMLNDVENEAETPQLIRVSEWQMQQKKVHIKNNQSDKQTLASILKSEPESFWAVVATCIVEDPFGCSDLADFVVSYEQYIK